MKYFLDSAKIDEIRYAYEHWGIDGVTTNPRHIKASGRGLFAVLEDLAKEFARRDFPISVEIDPGLTDSEAMVRAAEEIATLANNFCIKVPCTEPGLIAAKRLRERNIPTNVTLVFSASQALQAARLGSTFCSPFVGWREASGEDGMELIQTIMAVYRAQNLQTEVIVAAVRNGKQIVEAAKSGAHIVTAGLQVYRDSFSHPFTDHGIKVFRDAWAETDVTQKR